MLRYLSYGVVLMAALFISLPFVLPFDLIASRIVFPKLKNRTGIDIAAVKTSYAFPLSMTMAGVELSFPAGNGNAAVSVDSLEFSPNIESLFGDISGRASMRISNGNAAVHITPNLLTAVFDGVDAEKLLGGISGAGSRIGCTLRGEIEAERMDSAPARMKGTLTAENFSLRKFSFLGKEAPPIESRELTLSFSGTKSSLRIDGVKSIGGNVRIEGSGSTSEGVTFFSAPLQLRLKVYPTAEWLSKWGLPDVLLKRVRKPDGSFAVLVRGSLSNPETVPE